MRCIYYSYCYYYYYLQKHEAHVLTPYLEFNTCLSGVSRCSLAAAAAAAAADADSIISFAGCPLLDARKQVTAADNIST